MKGIWEIVSLNKVKLVEICLYLRPTQVIFLLIFVATGNKVKHLA